MNVLDLDPVALAEPFVSPEATPLTRESLPPEPYPVEALGPLRAAVEAIHDVTQAPTAIAAQSVLAVASLAVQAIADVETLGGRKPVSVFALTIAQSGERKSACDALAMKAVRDFEADLARERCDALADYQNALAVWQEQRKEALRSLKGDNADPEAARAELDRLGAAPEPPLYPSIVSATEPTLEGITKNLPFLRPSLGLVSDEGGAFIGGHAMKAENRLRTLAAFSNFWDGKPLDRWQAEDGVATFPGRRLACHLMVQPVAAAELLADPMAREQGFLARFLTAAPVSAIGTRLRHGHRDESEKALEAFHWRLTHLLRRSLPLKPDTRNELDPRLLALAPDSRILL